MAKRFQKEGERISNDNSCKNHVNSADISISETSGLIKQNRLFNSLEVDIHVESRQNKKSIMAVNSQNCMPNEQATFKPIDFISRIDRLRFIDDSASSTISTALASPADSLSSQRSQTRFLNELRNRNLQYDLIMLKKQQSSAKLSSTSTLCSDDTVKDDEATKATPGRHPTCKTVSMRDTSTKQSQYRRSKTISDTDSSSSSSLESQLDKNRLDHLSRPVGKPESSIAQRRSDSFNPNSWINKPAHAFSYEIKSPNMTGSLNSSRSSKSESIYACKRENNQEADNDDDEIEAACNDDSDKCFTSILVEDGFIRMTSPVDDSYEKTALFYASCELKCSRHGYSRNYFPNVGSSPVPEDAETIDNLHDDSSDELASDCANTCTPIPVPIPASSITCQSLIEPDKYSIEDDDDDEDVVIVYDDQLLVPNGQECVRNDVQTITDQCPRPQSIIKKPILRPDMLYTNKSECVQSVTVSFPSNDDPGSVQQQIASSKPKVRFNLDVNYEKEREWARINKIIGDAEGSSSVEWTDEVEV